MSARDDTSAYLQGRQTFVTEAIENADWTLIPLTNNWIAGNRDAVWAILTGIVEDYAEHAIEQALEQNTRGDNLDALNKLEDAYRDKPPSNGLPPVFEDILKRARMQP